MKGGSEMDRPYNRIMVPFDRDEWVRLRQTAESEMRNPRDQARYLVRQALGLADKPPNGEKHSGAGVRQDITGAAVTTFQA